MNVAAPPLPKPGSDHAHALGCKCPRMDNGYGRGYMGQAEIFVINETCPIHGTTTKDETR